MVVSSVAAKTGAIFDIAYNAAMRLLDPVLVLLCLTVLEASALSPEDAYAAIPHKRTTFDAQASKLPRPQVESLERLFALSDQGVILRVEGMRAQRARDRAGLKRVLEQYDALVADLQGQKFMVEVAPARDLVVQALRDQRRFLASRPEGGMQFVRQELTSTPEVTKASQNLYRAYSVLMQAFPGEPARNKTSFYDHLCALDYL